MTNYISPGDSGQYSMYYTWSPFHLEIVWTFVELSLGEHVLPPLFYCLLPCCSLKLELLLLPQKQSPHACEHHFHVSNAIDHGKKWHILPEYLVVENFEKLGVVFRCMPFTPIVPCALEFFVCEIKDDDGQNGTARHLGAYCRAWNNNFCSFSLFSEHSRSGMRYKKRCKIFNTVTWHYWIKLFTSASFQPSFGPRQVQMCSHGKVSWNVSNSTCSCTRKRNEIQSGFNYSV